MSEGKKMRLFPEQRRFIHAVMSGRKMVMMQSRRYGRSYMLKVMERTIRCIKRSVR
jgi:hypothetical protein